MSGQTAVRTGIAFVGVGIASAIVDAGTFSLAYAAGLRPAALASACGFLAAFVVNYSGNRAIVFRARHSGLALRRYIALVVVNLALTTGVVAGLAHLGTEPHLAKLVSMILVATLNFFAMRAWVFRESSPGRPSSSGRRDPGSQPGHPPQRNDLRGG